MDFVFSYSEQDLLVLNLPFKIIILTYQGSVLIDVRIIFAF